MSLTLLICTKCGIDISSDSKRRGLRCGSCTLSDKKAYYQKNKKKVKARRTIYYAKNKEAILKQMKERYHTNPEVQQDHIDSAIKSRYGISGDQYRYEYWRLFEMQDGKCAICKQDKKLVLDHDHSTGKIRALLCTNCNTAFGLMKENPNFVQGLLNYAKSYEK